VLQFSGYGVSMTSFLDGDSAFGGQVS
jgi:hypothetical protein